MAHGASDLLDVFRLVSDGDTSDTGQINKSQVWTSVRKDLEHNRLVNDVFVGTAYLISESVDVVANLAEVSKLAARNFVWEDTVGFDGFVNVIQTQFQGSSSDHTVTSGKEIETDDGLKNRRLSCRL